MPKGIKKKAAKKRPYNRRSKTQTITNVDSTDVQFITPSPKNIAKDNEVELLAIVCSVFDNLNDEQKQRFLKFICGRYYNFM